MHIHGHFSSLQMKLTAISGGSDGMLESTHVDDVITSSLGALHSGSGMRLLTKPCWELLCWLNISWTVRQLLNIFICFSCSSVTSSHF